MSYVRVKRVKGKEYRQLVESYREDGKPRQRVIAHLGQYPSLEAALEDLPHRIADYRSRAAAWCSQALSEIDKTVWPGSRHALWSERIQCGEQVPRPRRGGGGQKPYSRYWQLIDMADFYERRANLMDEKLRKLRAVREANH